MYKRSVIATALAMTLVAAGCGSDDTTTTTAAQPATTAAPETTTAAPETTTAAPETTTAAPETTTAAPETTAAEAPSGETLLVWADERRVPVIESIAPAFTEATGVEVQVELVSFDDMRDQVTQAGPAGEGPDIFAGPHDWTGELAANGVIDPVDISAIADQFDEVSLAAFNFEGQNYALPYVTEAVAMYRNTDLVADAPATWDDLVEACDAAAVENCVVVPGGGDGADAYHNYPLAVSSMGGYIFKYDPATGFDAAEVGLDAAETIAGATFLQEQVTNGIIPATNYDQAKNLFLEGKAAFWITGSWELGAMQEQTTVPNWAVSVIPQIGDNPVQPFVGAQGMYLSAFSDNALLAQSFLLDHVATDEVMQALYDADPRGTSWLTVKEGLAADANAQAFADSAANGIPMPNIPQMGSVWGPLGDNILLLRNGEIDAETAMTTAAEAVRSAIAG